MAPTQSLCTTGRAVELPTSSLRVGQGGAAIDGPTSSRASFQSFNGLRRGFSISSSQGDGQVIVIARTRGLRQSPSALRHTSVVAMSVADEERTVPVLNDLPLLQYINQNGRIQPPVESDTKASVFAIFDKNKKIHYIGFSKDVRNSLRTLMGRRPEMCYYFKIFNLNSLDQKTMLKCRQQWVSELGLPPVGNGDPVQKNLWEQPSDAGSISERGKAAAAASMAKTLVQTMKERGLKEEMVYDPELLVKGKCDVLMSTDLSVEEMDKIKKTQAEEAARRRAAVVTAPTGEKVEFEIFFEQKFPTNGGWMFDILVTKDDKETRHRVICGRIYPESVNLPEDRFVEIIIGFLLYKKVPRRTEGLLAGDAFPINYFAVSEVFQQFDDTKAWFEGLGELPDSYWRFNRIHDYGASNEDPMELGPGPSRDQPNFGSLVSSASV
ncbi:unnamed protein product [Calypogeia fissa]